MQRNLLLTGIPRSGTTLATALMDHLPDTVALNEPIWQTSRVAPNANAFAQWLMGDFQSLRQKLLAGEPIPERRGADGKPLTNYYAQNPITHAMETRFRTVGFTRPGLSADFTLAVKHNGLYLATLKALIETNFFTIIAIIRNPVDVIYSWRALDLPISHGDMPNAKIYWPALARLIDAPMDLLEKQIRLYDLMCKRLYNCRERIHILPYETLVKQPERLCQYSGVAGVFPSGLIGKASREVPASEREKITALLKVNGTYWQNFYPEI